MKYIVVPTSISLISFISNVNAFQPSLPKKNLFQVAASIDVDFYNPSREIDMEHAHDCADHFGKCSIDDLESMRTALHTERLQHEAANYHPKFEDDLDHILLEEDLAFQLALLNDEMNTLPKESPHYLTNGKHDFSPPPVMVESTGVAVAPHPEGRPDHNVQSFIQQSEEMFLIPNGFSDVAAFGAALLIISLAPFLFNH